MTAKTSEVETVRQREARLAKWRLICTVPCPHCQAPPGEPCPGTRSTPPHAARRHAAVNAGLYQP